MFGLVITVILFWVAVAFSLAIMYYYPLHFMMEGDRPLKTRKSVSSSWRTIPESAVLRPGHHRPGGDLRLHRRLDPGNRRHPADRHGSGKTVDQKYDYLEANPGADRKHLPWADLLYEENESIGPRS
jgi:hypothetical protein